MKILHFSWDTPVPGVGGSTHEWSVAEAFKKLGNSVRIVSEWEYDRKVSERIDDIDVRRIYWRTSVKPLNPLLLLVKGFANALYHIIDFSPSVVYERYRIFGGYGVIVGRLFGKKTILEVNDPTVDAPYIEKKIGFATKTLASLWERFVFACANRIVTHHEVMAKRAGRKKVLVVTNGVDTKLFNPENFNRTEWKNRFVCLFVGTFAGWQGISTIVDAAGRLSRYRNILFVFAGGNGEDKSNTLFLGKIEHSSVPQLIANSDVCLYVPDTENYPPMRRLGFYFSPLKLFEYMSMGKPVIVSDAGNLAKLVKNGVNGFRIKPNSSKELAEKILKLYKKRLLAKKIGLNNAKEARKRYDWKIIAKEMLEK